MVLMKQNKGRAQQEVWHRFSLAVFLVATALLLTGCGFMGLSQDLTMLDQTAEISGRVMNTTEAETPVFVALYEEKNEKQTLHAYWIAYNNSGEFRFLVPSGTYFLYAFEDKNENSTFQSDERIAWYGDPSPITTTAGSVFRNIDLPLNESAVVPVIFPQLDISLVTNVPMTVAKRQIGTVVALADRRFGPEYASKGLWEPVKFLEEPGAGLFFLETYSENKTPVLFVHGAGGFPQQWESMIQGLDRSRFQPWVLHYPSGLRLGLIGDVLEKYLTELQLKHQFKEMVIVAHSMGGLVSRFALNQHLVNSKENFIKLLITISTPWQGHRAAAFGVKQSPLVIPSWYDMVADSPFLKSIHRTALPPEVEFDLFFGYRGDANRNGELGDGTVLLSSMLDADMQKAATRIYGFDADHRNILTNQDVVQQLNQVLVKALQND